MHSNEDPVQPKIEINKLENIFFKFKASDLIYHVGNQGLVTLFGQEGKSDGKGFWGIANVLFPALSGDYKVVFISWSFIKLYRSDLHTLIYITQKMFS